MGGIASTLSIPLFVAVGIIFRGTAYALRSGTSTPRELRLIDTAFSLSSILTPFALGTVVGAIASRRVPVGNAAGDRFTSRLNPTSLLVGLLAVATTGYTAAPESDSPPSPMRPGRTQSESSLLGFVALAFPAALTARHPEARAKPAEHKTLTALSCAVAECRGARIVGNLPAGSSRPRGRCAAARHCWSTR